MNSLQRMKLVLSGKKADRIPWVPAIYEHKAFLINRTPSEVACNAELLYQAVIEEFSVYQPDILTIGVDVYNIEAEAMGCKVKFYKTNDIPAISEHVFSQKANFRNLRTPNPLKDGRMPLIIEVGKRVLHKLGKAIMVRGAMCGPFSLASSLCGSEKLLILTLRDPNYVKHLMEFCTRVLIIFGQAYLNADLGIAVFDSMCSLVSPLIYKKLIMPCHNELMLSFREKGLEHRALIIGGNTTALAECLTKVNANQVLCDYNADLEYYIKATENTEIAVRANIDPELIQRGPIEKIIETGSKILEVGSRMPRFILGSGVIPYNTPKVHVLALKKLVEDYK